MTRVMLAVEITPGEYGRCGGCEYLSIEDFATGGTYFTCGLGYQNDLARRSPACLAAEKLLRDVVEAGEAMRGVCPTGHPWTQLQLDKWDRALAALLGR